MAPRTAVLDLEQPADLLHVDVASLAREHGMAYGALYTLLRDPSCARWVPAPPGSGAPSHRLGGGWYLPADEARRFRAGVAAVVAAHRHGCRDRRWLSTIGLMASTLPPGTWLALHHDPLDGLVVDVVDPAAIPAHAASLGARGAMYLPLPTD